MLRKLVLTFVSLILLSGVVFLAGPRVDLSYRPEALVLPDDLETYLRRAESRFPAVVPGAEKTIVWAHPDHRKTELAIVYLHGFSATRQETAPTCDLAARQLGANLYYARLTGHGLGGNALADATVNNWLNDAIEALRIGERLGERVVIVGCSTGAALASWLAAEGDNRNVLGYVLISANYAPADPAANYLTWPWARQLIPRAVGETIEWSVLNERHGRYWTTTYPTTALLPMMGVCKLAQDLPYEQLQTPALFIYSPADKVVDVKWIEQVYERWGSDKKELVPFSPRGEPETHVIAGDIRAPSGTEPVADMILRFVGRLKP